MLYIGSREIFSQGITRALSPDVFLRNNIRPCYNWRVSIPAAHHDRTTSIILVNLPSRMNSKNPPFQALCITSRDYKRRSFILSKCFSLSRIRFAQYKLYLKRFRILVFLSSLKCKINSTNPRCIASKYSLIVKSMYKSQMDRYLLNINFSFVDSYIYFRELF